MNSLLPSEDADPIDTLSEYTAVEHSPSTTPEKTSADSDSNADSSNDLIPELKLALLENTFDLLTADLDEMMKVGKLFDLPLSGDAKHEVDSDTATAPDDSEFFTVDSSSENGVKNTNS